MKYVVFKNSPTIIEFCIINTSITFGTFPRLIIFFITHYCFAVWAHRYCSPPYHFYSISKMTLFGLMFFLCNSLNVSFLIGHVTVPSGSNVHFKRIGFSNFVSIVLIHRLYYYFNFRESMKLFVYHQGLKRFLILNFLMNYLTTI